MPVHALEVLVQRRGVVRPHLLHIAGANGLKARAHDVGARTA